MEFLFIHCPYFICIVFHGHYFYIWLFTSVTLQNLQMIIYMFKFNLSQESCLVFIGRM